MSLLRRAGLHSRHGERPCVNLTAIRFHHNPIEHRVFCQFLNGPIRLNRPGRQIADVLFARIFEVDGAKLLHSAIGKDLDPYVMGVHRVRILVVRRGIGNRDLPEQNFRIGSGIDARLLQSKVFGGYGFPVYRPRRGCPQTRGKNTKR